MLTFFKKILQSVHIWRIAQFFEVFLCGLMGFWRGRDEFAASPLPRPLPMAARAPQKPHSKAQAHKPLYTISLFSNPKLLTFGETFFDLVDCTERVVHIAM